MTPTHALIAAGAIVAVGGLAIAWAACVLAGRDDDHHGRPRG